MSSQAPWSIKGVDKETREKMKQMAHQQGMSLADFLENLMHASSNIEKKIENNTLSQNLDHYEDDDEEPIQQSDKQDSIVKSDRDNENDNVVRPQVFHHPQDNFLATSDEVLSMDDDNQNHSPQEITPIANKEIAVSFFQENNTTSTTHQQTHKTQKTRKKSAPLDHNQKATQPKIATTSISLFNQLTQKAGITNSAISEVASHNISETVMRERQLRDMMRVQMTEMKQMFNQLLDEAVDKKFDDIKSFLNQSLSDVTQQNHQSYQTQSDNSEYSPSHQLVSKNDFVDVISQVTLEIDHKIDTKLQQQLDTIHELNQKSSTSIHEAIEKITISLNNTDNGKISQLINEAITNHAFSQSDLSGGDLAIFSALKDNAEVLSSRMARIEDVCAALDEKLTHIQTDVSYTLQPENNHINDFQELHHIKEELENYVKSIPDYLDSALKKNSSDMTPVVNTLQMTSERILKLEAIVKTLASKVERDNFNKSVPLSNGDTDHPYQRNFSQTSHMIDEDIEPQQSYQNVSENNNNTRYDEIDKWDDDDSSETHEKNEKNFNNLYALDDIDNPQHNPHDFLSDSEDVPHDIREMDRDAFLSGTRKKFEKKMSEKKNDIDRPQTFIEQLGGIKNLVLFGTMGITVFILLTLVFQ